MHVVQEEEEKVKANFRPLACEARPSVLLRGYSSLRQVCGTAYISRGRSFSSDTADSSDCICEATTRANMKRT